MRKQPNPETGLTVAITGHRELADRNAIAADLVKALALIERSYPTREFSLLSPLAEGADRLAASLIQERPGWKLVAVLPLPVEDYRRDFSSAASQHEFDRLLDQAQATYVLHPPADQRKVYQRLGEYLVDHCQVLLAIWDGQPARGPGGTAEIVELARQRGLPLGIIPLVNGLPRTNGATYECFPSRPGEPPNAVHSRWS